MINTTLNQILSKGPCGQMTNGKTGFSKLLKYLEKSEADDEPLSFMTILESNGIKDAIWCLRVFPEYDLKVMEFKLKCARRVEHLDASGKAKDCLDVLEKFISGAASKDELHAASAYAASAASAYAPYAASAYAASAASAASAAYAYAAYAASAYAASAAYAERKYQTKIFIEIFG